MDSTPRVRFAPSPTGRLHVGGARTALFNWLFARHQGGTMVLRIEDTDIERSTRQSEDSLLRDLRWLGIDWDEGPDVGGPHGPYRQSERRDAYVAAAVQLLRAGVAYPSDDADPQATASSESHARQAPRQRTPMPRFDVEETVRQLSSPRPPAIRFRLPEETIHYEDVVRGRMQIDPGTLSDFVLIRSNGLPTYNFACVVDDAAMQITHVLRGEDHLYNTSRQVLLYDALQRVRPQFVHLPLILDEDRAKLKKRQGREGTFVDDYRQRGFLPEALMNFLALLGWSPESGDDILDRRRLIAEFDLQRLSRAAAVFDVQKLRWMGGEYLRALDPQELAARALPFLQSAALEATEAQRLVWIRTFQRYLVSLDELPQLVRDVLEPGAADAEAAEALRGAQVPGLLGDLVARLQSMPQPEAIDGPTFKGLLKDSGKACGVKGKALFQPVRAALTGRGHGPDLPQLVEVIGGTETLHRLQRAADAVGSPPG
jgi:nondiscriminating glutamyl-tRNA synthetase